MRNRWWGPTLLLLASLVVGSSCLPNRGTPVFVDSSAGNLWSGKAVLVEVSEDERQCRVVVRDANLITRNRWVDCNHIHERRGS